MVRSMVPIAQFKGTLYRYTIIILLLKQMNLQILPSPLIDTTKWDDCISRSANGLIYASSRYLNAMADNWDGMIIDDYKAVMPLPWRE